MEALSVCGAVFLEASSDMVVGSRLPEPEFCWWHELWHEAVTSRSWFQQREPVRQRLLSFNRSEDLARTMQGGEKSHTPDLRYNFGVTCWNALHRGDQEWQDLWWIAKNFRDTLGSATELLRRELLPELEADGALVLTPAAVPADGFAQKLRSGRGENWSGSRLRHSVYPVNGSCTEHTDYGVLTFQQSTALGLEANIFGEWRSLHGPPGTALVFAGDMFELLTNGTVPALRHRVTTTTLAASHPQSAVRQSHILFLQPDKGTVVAPLGAYRRHDGTDRKPVRYGDWHNQKANLAFHN